ncbi:MAG: amidohydrolase [Sphingobacteriales bacterium UTBCD1]|nr:MAG: amidohydrolase [Sphingobacteriales bacterium UTBCD1]
MDRRSFVSNTVASAAGLLLGSNLVPSIPKGQSEKFSPEKRRMVLMEEVMKYRKIDTHAHVYFSPDSPTIQIDFAERLGIEKLVISRNIEAFSKGTPEEFRRCNDLVIKCMKDHPDRFIGTMVLNPTYTKESLEEIKRCVDAGMVGAGELYNQVKINDPLYYPIIEKFIDLKMIMLMHSAIGKSRVLLNLDEPPNISLPEDFVEIAARYPEAMFQFAHIGGGIDWEYACKALAHSPNIFVDVSGSNNEAGMIDFALKYIGEDRLLFGCDNSFYQGVGHMLSDNLSESQRKKIFFDNYNAILKKSGNNVN